MIDRLRNRPRITGTFGLFYVRRHRRLVTEMLSSPQCLSAFRQDGTLPSNYGVGLDERVVEYPWLLACGLRGAVLDAGSSLNYPHVLDAVLPSVDSLSIITLAPEPASFPERGVSYLFADLRRLPLRDGLFDTIVSISTLEHIGMDNTLYADRSERASDPDEELSTAVHELKRVLSPGGRILVTLPYGNAEDHGWLRQFDEAMIKRLIRNLSPREYLISVFLYTGRGWQVSSLGAAQSANYRDRNKPASDDRAAAARAVACLELSF
jgi:SAM-dependent methyltransferase